MVMCFGNQSLREGLAKEKMPQRPNRGGRPGGKKKKRGEKRGHLIVGKIAVDGGEVHQEGSKAKLGLKWNLFSVIPGRCGGVSERHNPLLG